MKLSVAIRKGIELDGEQCYHNYAEFDKDGKVIRCCALGAAAIGLKGLGHFEPCHEQAFSSALLPLLGNSIPKSDVPKEFLDHRGTKRDSFVVDDVVVTLNDSLKWTRERIADWLESIGR